MAFKVDITWRVSATSHSKEETAVDDLAGIGDVSDEEQKKLDALDEYVAQTCPELEGEPDSSESP